MSINAVNYGADPTGAKDSTAAIQRAVDDVASHGGGSVELPRGIYRVSYPFIEIKHRVEVIGQGPATVVIAHSDRAIPTTSDGYIEYTGVFHVGSYTTPVYGAYNANKPMRMGVRNLHIRTNAANTPIDSYPLDAHTTPLDHVAGVIMHTHFTGDQLNEPDVVPVIAGVEVWDTAIGVAVLGLDDQGMKIDDVTVRRTLNQGLLLGKPVGHRRRSTEGQNSGAADNKLRGVDVAEANLSGGSYAGIEVYAAQSKFENCSSNSNHRTLGKSALYEPGTRNAGAGWIVQGERNMFIGCTARSNAGHGWLVEWANNVFIGCAGEASSWAGTVSGAARADEAANWYISRNARGTRMVAPVSYNPPEQAASLYGYYIENKIYDLRITDGVAQDERIGENNMLGRRVYVTGEMGANVVIEVEDLRHTTSTPAQLRVEAYNVMRG